MRTTTFQDRMTILTLAEAGHTDSEIAQLVGWRLPTVRKWRRRGQREGRTGLASHMGRPPTGAMATFPSPVQETLSAWRQEHPRWGPQTLRIESESEKSLNHYSLPSRATIARWLKQEGLTRRYERHRGLPQPPTARVEAPHQEWELDARGYELVPDVGVITLIDLSDRFSRVKLLSYPCLLGEKRVIRHPNTLDYQLVLRLAFSEWGLPDRISVDRESVFYDNLSRSPFPTLLHLWLLALGVSLRFGHPGRATERGMIERSHQTWEWQALKGSTFSSWEALRHELQQRRDFLNERFRSASPGDIPLLVAHPEVRWPRRLYRPEWEIDSLDLSRVYTYLSHGQWFRKASNIGAVSLGTHVYVLGRDWARQEVEITFDPADRRFFCRTADGKRTKRLAIQGITPFDLMGEMGPLAHLDQFQLALPFSWDEWRVIQLCETMVS